MTRLPGDHFSFKVSKILSSYVRRTQRKYGQQDFYTVVFDKYGVTCTCDDFVKLIYNLKKNHCCKHIALIAGKCRDSLQLNYGGQNKFSSIEFPQITALLDTFNANKEVLSRSSDELIKTTKM